MVSPYWKANLHKYESKFRAIGDFAKSNNIRLSFHPGQFCVLASSSADVIKHSIEEFEYHADMARLMGYGSEWHDYGFKINVHVAGQGGPTGIRKTLRKLSKTAQNLISIENDEISWGIDSILELADCCALVLDVHHHSIYSKGDYLSPASDAYRKIVDSWRGVRPVVHYSISKEDLFSNIDQSQLIDISDALTTKNVRDLRAHSNDAWHRAHNEYVLGFLPTSDIMVEAKYKNLAAVNLANQYLKNN